mgnify:CR=1 FL=1
MAEKKAAKPVTTIPLSKIVAELAEAHELSKKAMAAIFTDFVERTVKNLKKGNKVRITGLGIMQVRARPARMGRNPRSGEQVVIPEKLVPHFKPGKALREARALGLIRRLPRVASVQAAGANPLLTASPLPYHLPPFAEIKNAFLSEELAASKSSNTK